MEAAIRPNGLKKIKINLYHVFYVLFRRTGDGSENVSRSSQ
jgi:hypothetical protein